MRLQAFALTDEYNPLFVPGGLQLAASMIKDAGVVAEAIRAGPGLAVVCTHSSASSSKE